MVTHSSTPSGQIPVYKKPPASKKGKKPGQKKGHEGVRRKTPLRIDRGEKHTLDTCPDCGNKLGTKTRSLTRIIEDVKAMEPETVEH